MIARSVDESCSQRVYAENAKIEKCDGIYKIDLGEVYSYGAKGLFDEFFVSIKGDASSELLTSGASLEEYERGDGYITYKIKPEGAKIIEIKT